MYFGLCTLFQKCHEKLSKKYPALFSGVFASGSHHALSISSISVTRKNTYLNFILSLAAFFDYVDTVKKSYENIRSFAGLVNSFTEGLVAMFKNL